MCQNETNIWPEHNLYKFQIESTIQSEHDFWKCWTESGKGLKGVQIVCPVFKIKYDSHLKTLKCIIIPDNTGITHTKQ